MYSNDNYLEEFLANWKVNIKSLTSKEYARVVYFNLSFLKVDCHIEQARVKLLLVWNSQSLPILKRT